MSANAVSQMNFDNTQARLVDGEEPTELLLALVSSPLMTLLARGVAYVVKANDSETGEDVLAVVFANCRWNESVGIVQLPTLPVSD